MSEDRERAVLLAKLDVQRSHVLGTLEGLSDEQLREAALPSGWTPLGLVQHLALDVERFWFACVVRGDEAAIAALDDPPEDAWVVDDARPAAAVLDEYRMWIDRANVATAETPLDAAPAWWPEGLFGSWRLHDLREVVVHVLAETATHAGHLDAARELADGRQWSVLNR